MACRFGNDITTLCRLRTSTEAGRPRGSWLRGGIRKSWSCLSTRLHIHLHPPSSVSWANLCASLPRWPETLRLSPSSCSRVWILVTLKRVRLFTLFAFQTDARTSAYTPSAPRPHALPLHARTRPSVYEEAAVLTVICAAEAAIKQQEGTPGFSIALLHIVADASIPQTSRLAAALYFKNFVRRNWTVCIRPSASRQHGW